MPPDVGAGHDGAEPSEPLQEDVTAAELAHQDAPATSLAREETPGIAVNAPESAAGAPEAATLYSTAPLPPPPETVQYLPDTAEMDPTTVAQAYAAPPAAPAKAVHTEPPTEQAAADDTSVEDEPVETPAGSADQAISESAQAQDTATGDAPAEAASSAAVASPQQKQLLPDTYDPATLQLALRPSQLSAASAQLTQIAHLPAHRRNNLVYISDTLVLTSAGNAVIFYDTATQQMDYMHGLDGGGIGCICLHPNGRTFVVAEQCRTRAPNAYVYNHLGGSRAQLHRVLRNGTERGYSAAAFNKDGSMLATVGGTPDYMLTLWDWQEETVILRCKAFGQEVCLLPPCCTVHG